jgi:hypothetical protein
MITEKDKRFFEETAKALRIAWLEFDLNWKYQIEKQSGEEKGK